MRELKFRAWDKVTKRYYAVSGLEYDDNGNLCEVYLAGIQIDESDLYANVRNPSDVILEQYTGLKDCNNKEIHAGDILRWISSTGRELRYAVKWDTSAWCWTAGGYMLGGIIEQDCQVIGNIHENEDLL